MVLTLNFCGCRLPQSSSSVQVDADDLLTQMVAIFARGDKNLKRDMTMQLMGLTHTRNTLVGNAMIRWANDQFVEYQYA